MLTNTTQVSLNHPIKKRRKNKQNSLQAFTPLIKSIATLDISNLNQSDDQKFMNFLEKYRLYEINNIYKNSNKEQKLQMLKQIKFKSVVANQNIVTLVSRKQYKQIYILLQGNAYYKYIHDNKLKIYQNSHKCGQILSNSYLSYVPFPHFSIISSLPCIFLQISVKTMLWEKISKIKTERQFQLLQTFKTICKNSQKQKLLNLIQYFSEYNYYKDEIICSRKGKQSSLNFISEGEVQIIKQNENKKPISVVNLNQYRFFYYQQNKNEGKTTSIKCKSINCKIFSIPLFIFYQIAPLQIKQILTQDQAVLETIYQQLIKKNQTINKNPLKFLNLQRKKRNIKSRSQFKSKSKSLYKSNKPWDLVDHFVEQLDIKSQKSLQILRRTKSAQISRRDQPAQSISLSKSIQHLKKKILKDNNETSEKSQCQQKIIPNYFRTTLNSNKSHSSYLQSVQKINHQKQSIINRITLIKKTKFKLQRYAKGQNLYGLHDYID